MTETQKQGKQEKLQQLYSLVLASAQTPPPKKSLFGMKCPKCGSRLSKESVKGMLFAGEGGSEFAKKVVIEDAGIEPGVYVLRVDKYTCKCDYQFAVRDIDTPPDSADG